LFFHDDHRLRDRFRIAAEHDAVNAARGEMAALDLGAHHRRQIAAGTHLQPPLEAHALARRHRGERIQILRPVADMIEIIRMQRDGPIFIVSDHAVRERRVGLALRHSLQARHSEHESAVRPQRQPGQQIGQSHVAAIAQRGSNFHVIGIRLEHIHRDDRGLAPVARGANLHTLGALLHDVDVLIGIRPSGPIVGNEIREHHTVAADRAVGDRRQVDERAARNAVGHRRLHRQRKRQFFVDHGDVARRSRITLHDGRRTHEYAHGRLRRAGSGQRHEAGDQQPLGH
jgi:hypothetical protein